MIIQRSGTALLFITQPDHARLAAAIMAAWRTDGLPDHPRRDTILLATREHDNGWLEEDQATMVDGSGEPVDFISAPAAIKHRVWPRGAMRTGDADPYAGALVARHALTVYGQQKTDAAWTPFFARMEAVERELLARCPPDAAGTMASDYRFVQAGDQLSLVFCNRWTAPFPRSPLSGPGGAGKAGRTILKGTTLEISPDPFGGARVPLRVRARRLPARTFASAAELRAALDETPVTMIEGDAVGVAS